MKEIFKDIEGYENLYQISNLGIVKALGNGKSNNSKERILKQIKDKNGYLFVNLYKQGKKIQYYVHRLVAMAFIENPNNFRELNHIDEDKTNNCVSNLEWCTREYNIKYGTRTEKTSKRVLCVETGKIYPSTRELERQLGFYNSNISKCCNGRYKQAYGFHWRYVN